MMTMITTAMMAIYTRPVYYIFLKNFIVQLLTETTVQRSDDNNNDLY